MQLIPESFIQTLLGQADMLTLASRRGVEFKKAGSEFVAVCPFHNEKSGSFSYAPRKQMYHCFGCNKTWNAISFVMEADGLPFRDAVEVLASETGMQMPSTVEVREDHSRLFEILAKSVEHYRETLRNHPDVIAYLHERGIGDEAIDRFEIGFADAKQSKSMAEITGSTFDECVSAGVMKATERGMQYNVMRSRVIFPIKDQRGRTIALGGRRFGPPDPKSPKYMNTPETALYTKGKTLFGVPQAMRNNRMKSAVMVEGYVDTVALTMADIPSLAFCGTAVTEAHIREVCRLGIETIYFGMDGDAAGVKATMKAIATALPVLPSGKRLMIVEMPVGKDPDEVLLEQGRGNMLKLIEQARFPSEVIVGTNLSTAELRSEAVERLKQLSANMPEGSLRDQLQLKAKEISSGIRGRSLERPVTSREGLTSGERLVALLLDLPEARQAAWLVKSELPPLVSAAVECLKDCDLPAARIIEAAPADMAAFLERLAGYSFSGTTVSDVKSAFDAAVYDHLRGRAQETGAFALVERLSALQDALTGTRWEA